MSALDDLKEQLTSEAKLRWEQFQDSSLFIQVKERYENLTPPAQKATLAAVAVIFLLLIFSLPMGYYSTSSEYVTTFEDQRQLIRDMLKVSRESHEVPDIPVPPDLATLRAQIEAQLQSARLVPEQIKGTENSADAVRLIPGNLSQGALNVSLVQLNLRQVIDIGHSLQSISPSVKLTDLKMEASTKDARYFDVIYRLVILSVPQQTAAAPEFEPPAQKKKGDE
jgi:hypothetical protein